MREARFLAIEGIDGAGKSTLAALLAVELRSRGVELLLTREPGGTPLGEALRQLLLTEAMHPETELLLLCAARREHLLARIEPALAAGSWVISDRFADASFAYQVAGRGVERERFALLDRWTRAGLDPDLTVLLDIAPECALQRVKTERYDRFHQEPREFFARARAAYLERAESEPQRYLVLNAEEHPPETLARWVLGELQQRCWV